MNTSVYLGMAILDISKTLMQKFWYDYIKPKCQDNANLCYMDTASFIIDIKTEDFQNDIADDVEKWFETSNYSEDDKRLHPRGMNKKEIGLFKDEPGGKIIIEIITVRSKTYSFLMDDNSEQKKAKGTKKICNKMKT